MGLWGVFIGPLVASILHALILIFNAELAELSRQVRFSTQPGTSALLRSTAAPASSEPQAPTPADTTAASILPLELELRAAEKKALERALREFPEVETVVCKTGRSEIAMDPMGVEMTDVLVALKPRDTWRYGTREELVEAMEESLREHVPGIVFGFSQPIKMRMNELIAGSRADIALKLYGEDLEVLRERSEALVRVLREVPGAQDVRAEQISGLPMLRVHVDRQAAARYGVRVQDVLDAVAALGGIQVTQVYEGSLRYAVEVRFDPATRRALSLLESLPVAASAGQTVPLSQVADLEEETGPAQVGREDLERRVTVQVNVRGRDIAPSTATQILVQRLLGVATPRYRHHFLLLESAAAKLAKLHGSIPFSLIRSRYDGPALCGVLAHGAGLVATTAPITPAALVAEFDWARVSRVDRLARWDAGLVID